ncbi:hypothetical protein ADIARSV_4056 [Arcticibacter svalbardensis MN12-7]|uniref:Lipoprotein n=2 Tax=Arcticibacter TaxID=1288026 RepID=R9GV21_9SPHI|nr:hypothetical protein ADIARSV_4056 [Arcticibacter svalbardensis MN12-7]
MFSITIIGCKKDKLDVNETKDYFEVTEKPQTDLAGGAMHLMLKPDGTADITLGGDVSYRGTYKISGSKIKVKTDQDSGSYTFEIISESQIKSKDYGTLLKLKE